MTGTAVARVDTETGEVVTPVQFDVTGYLKGLDQNITSQHALMAAYDKAVADLIGPNDVQVEGPRTFKKKSAWRKLARHFHLSTAVVRVERDFLPTAEGPVFCATVTVRATSPWGQEAEAVGACGTDEETGRRKITIADAIATAETRATNRAVSNLIAMGEVSAEEIGERKPLPAHRPRNPARPPVPAEVQRAMDVLDGEEPADAGGAPPCPKCGGVMWDNRASKPTPKHPDFKCKSKECGKAVWLTSKAVSPIRRLVDEPPPLDEMPPALANEGDDLPF